MKNRSVVFTTIAIVIVILILGFGLYSVLSPFRTVTSDVVFNFKDDNLKIDINGEAEWAPASNSQKYFSTSTTTSGLTEQSWKIPDIVFVTSENPEENFTSAVIKLAISNKNTDYPAKVTVSGVAFDQDGRFVSQIVFKNPITNEEIAKHDIESSTQQVSQNIPIATSENDENAKVIIEIRYQLEKTYSDIEVQQNINVTLENVNA